LSIRPAETKLTSPDILLILHRACLLGELRNVSSDLEEWARIRRAEINLGRFSHTFILRDIRILECYGLALRRVRGKSSHIHSSPRSDSNLLHMYICTVFGGDLGKHVPGWLDGRPLLIDGFLMRVCSRRVRERHTQSPMPNGI
jgi:hypothetical protein